MNRNEKIALGIAGAAALFLFLRGRALMNLVYTPGPVQGFTMDGATPIVTASLIVSNTNNQSFVMNSFAGSVYANDAGKRTWVGDVYGFQPVQIPANSQAQINLNFRLFTIGIVNTLLNAIQYKQDERTIEIDATVNVDGLQYNIGTISYQLGV